MYTKSDLQNYLKKNLQSTFFENKHFFPNF